MRDRQTFDVPSFDPKVLGERRTRYCIVIPTINEGERIRGQLARMHASAMMKLADVIVADAGSCDGSLDPDALRSWDVRVLLTKTGPGKLSAQLRMAYAYALDAGYEGIVTIDGNGKDSMNRFHCFSRRSTAVSITHRPRGSFPAGGGSTRRSCGIGRSSLFMLRC